MLPDLGKSITNPPPTMIQRKKRDRNLIAQTEKKSLIDDPLARSRTDTHTHTVSLFVKPAFLKPSVMFLYPGSTSARKKENSKRILVQARFSHALFNTRSSPLSIAIGFFFFRSLRLTRTLCLFSKGQAREMPPPSSYSALLFSPEETGAAAALSRQGGTAKQRKEGRYRIASGGCSSSVPTESQRPCASPLFH